MKSISERTKYANGVFWARMKAGNIFQKSFVSILPCFFIESTLFLDVLIHYYSYHTPFHLKISPTIQTTVHYLRRSKFAFLTDLCTQITFTMSNLTSHFTALIVSYRSPGQFIHKALSIFVYKTFDLVYSRTSKRSNRSKTLWD